MITFNPRRDAVTYSLTELKRMKDEGNISKGLLEELKRYADKILPTPTVTVMQRKLRAPSGNPHAYTSMGPYWWPNPDTPNGLPYIRRDGEVNPESKDDKSFSAMATQAHTLALAAFYLEDERYAKRAVDALYDWYVNPDTYMIPNARYAQFIPGRCDGRSIGLIDFSSSFMAMDAVRLLEAMGAIDEEIVKSIENWYVTFTDWMLTSEMGVDEGNQHNNHATWYDVQVLASAIFTGRMALARKIIATTYDRRFRTQIKPDGSQPHELARTNAMGYSNMNMRGFMKIAIMAEKLGDGRFFETDAKLGDCLLKLTLDFLYPYVSGEREFPYAQIHAIRSFPHAVDAMRTLEVRFPGMGYGERATALSNDTMLGLLVPVK